MNKSELLDQISSSVDDVPKAKVEEVLKEFFDTVTEQTKRGDKVSWPGFGSFSTTKRKARTGRNPQTGQPVRIPATTAMKFTASSTLKENLNTRGKKAASKKKATKKKGPAKKKSAAKKKTKSTAKKAKKR